MTSTSIQSLLLTLKEIYGADRIIPYGTDANEKHGTGFRIAGVAATFSVTTRDGSLPEETFDFQFESYPPGDYIYVGVVNRDDLLRLVEQMTGPPEFWPVMD
jgi:hypothetical protein